jgi:hypothetical protein
MLVAIAWIACNLCSTRNSALVSVSIASARGGGFSETK